MLCLSFWWPTWHSVVAPVKSAAGRRKFLRALPAPLLSVIGKVAMRNGTPRALPSGGKSRP